MLSAQLDACVLTETWLKDKDQIWLDTSDIVTDGFKCVTYNREKPGGGLTLVYKDIYKVSRINDNFTPQTFEKCSWKMERDNKVITMEVIYHSPGRPGQSISKFTEELAQYAEKLALHRNNPILLGDFNIHVNDLDDGEAIDFITTMEVLGLIQHVDFTTQ